MVDSLVIAIGNTLRGDDGVAALLVSELTRRQGAAPAAAARAWQAMGRAAPELRQVQQLTPELSADLAAVRRVLFVDAWLPPPLADGPAPPAHGRAPGSRSRHPLGPEPLLRPLEPPPPAATSDTPATPCSLAASTASAPTGCLGRLDTTALLASAGTTACIGTRACIGTTATTGSPASTGTQGPMGAFTGFSHQLDPAQLLAITQLLFGRAPAAWELLLPAHQLGHGEGLSDRMRRQLPRARLLLRQWCCGEAVAGRGQAPVGDAKASAGDGTAGDSTAAGGTVIAGTVAGGMAAGGAGGDA